MERLTSDVGGDDAIQPLPLFICQVATAIPRSFHDLGISQPAVSQHLRVLRESGFTTVRADGTRRLYAVDSAPLQEVDIWLEHFRRFWIQRLDALGTELARGKRERREKDDSRTQVDGTQPTKGKEDT